MLTSKEVLDQTGISRATLNNYIASGIVPRPEVLPPGPDHGDAPRIGYFPEEVVARIAEIQRLKGLGWSLTRIAEHLAAPGARPGPSRIADAAPAPAPSAGLASTDARIQSPSTSVPHAQASEAPRGAPVLTAVAVLAAHLDNPHRIWAALPPGEYFELINQIWYAIDPIVRRHHGVHGKHASDGMVCYFFPRAAASHLWNALSAALEIREAMRVISREWLVRKGWPLEVHLKTGLDEGQEWLGSLWSSAQPEFAGLAPTIRRAMRIAESAPAGVVWASKSLVARLSPDQQHQLRYGIRQRGLEGADRVVASVFDSPSGFGDLPDRPQEYVARGPVTEILGIAPAHEK